jgi:hypothetical protein
MKEGNLEASRIVPPYTLSASPHQERGWSEGEAGPDPYMKAIT